MSSKIFYKFKSARDFDVFQFEGHAVPLWQFKAEVLNSKKIKPSDFDLVVINANDEKQYKEDNELISRGVTVYVKRVPCVTRKEQNVRQLPSGFNTSQNVSEQSVPKDTSEESRIRAMIKESEQHWDLNKEITSHGVPLAKKRLLKPTKNVPVPLNYICYRCGKQGHHINMCPTNNDPAFDRPKIKKTTGIPKTFLKKVDAGERATGTSIMIDPHGGVVVALPNEDLWNQATASKGTLKGVDTKELVCGLCNNLMSQPVILPCCKTRVCEGCLLERDNTCQACNIVIDHRRLARDGEMERRIAEFKSA